MFWIEDDAMIRALRPEEVRRFLRSAERGQLRVTIVEKR